MSNQLEQLPRDPSNKHLHRLRLLPIVEFVDEDITLKAPVRGGSRRPGGSLVTAPPDLEPWEQEQFQFKREVVKPETRNFDVDDPEFEKLVTIPMMVLKGISKQQGKATPVMESEITGAASNASIVGRGNMAGYMFSYASNLL